MAGIQVAPEEEEEFAAFLQQLDYPYVDESDNALYRMLLRN